MNSLRSRSLAYAALVAICLIWGTTYLALRVAVLEFPPFLFVVIRQLLAGTILVSLVLLFRPGSRPTRAQLQAQAIAGFFMISLGNGLVAWAEVVIPSGVAAIICSTMPLMTLLLNFVFQLEKPDWKSIAGIPLGFLGILVIFSGNLQEVTDPRYVVGIVVLLIAVLGWSAGSIWSKFRATGDPFMNAGLQMLFGALWLVPVTLLMDDYTTLNLTSRVIWPLVYLVLLGSVVAYAAFSYTLRQLPMAVVSIYAYVNPVVAVLLGWLILGEALHFSMITGSLLILVAIYVVNHKTKK